MQYKVKYLGILDSMPYDRQIEVNGNMQWDHCCGYEVGYEKENHLTWETVYASEEEFFDTSEAQKYFVSDLDWYMTEMNMHLDDALVSACSDYAERREVAI